MNAAQSLEDIMSDANRSRLHQSLVDDLLHAFGSRSDVRCWTRMVGCGRHLYRDQIFKFGIPGETDLQGIVRPNGRMLCIEVKTGKGILSKEQKRWKEMVESYGAIYIEARSVEQAVAEFELKKLPA